MKHAVQSVASEVAGFTGLLVGLALFVTSLLGPDWRMLMVPGSAFLLAAALYGSR